ncbi:MAG: glucose 1-dehydrogenase [Actinomycetota bacterium]|jgi:3-oxoacyl-[acyl-carrier protein] reductase
MDVPGVTGRVAVVTGAGRGIGRELARGLAAAGARVVVAEIDGERAQETADLIGKDGGEALAVVTDVTDEASTAAMAARAVEAYGGIDILVNNAGLWAGLAFEPPTEIRKETWSRVLDVNVTGMWLATKAVAAPMTAAGRGVIVNISSVGAFLAGPMLSHYCTSKGAVNAFTRAMAKDLGASGIRVNAIAPGVIGTESTLETAPAELLDAMVASQCIKRKGDPADLVGPLLFLAGDASAFMSGQVIVVDGGLVMLG